MVYSPKVIEIIHIPFTRQKHKHHIERKRVIGPNKRVPIKTTIYTNEKQGWYAKTNNKEGGVVNTSGCSQRNLDNKIEREREKKVTRATRKIVIITTVM